MVLVLECKNAGHAVIVAEAGAEALHATQTGGFGLIITDFQMPVMDGVEFCRRLR